MACYGIKSYVMPRTSQHIPQTATKIGLFPSPRDSQTSALSASVRSTSDFAVSDPARIKCMAQVAAHHDMVACLCVSLFIGRGVLDEHACSCVAQCNAFRAGAAPGRLGCSTTRARRPSPPPRGGPGLRERNRSASDPVFPAPWRHGEGRPQVQQRSYGHQSRPNLFRSIRETEYAARATTWRLHSAPWAFRCRYLAASPASGNYQ